jgi:hypothetical protein
MAELLRPYEDFEPDALGRALYDQAKANKDALAGRHLLDVVERYGGTLDDAITTVENEQHSHAAGNVDHYVVTGEDRTVIGAASVRTGLTLRRLPLLFPLVLPVGPLQERVLPAATHQLVAWIDARNSTYTYYLGRVYQELQRLTAEATERSAAHAWALEPIRPYVPNNHMAIHAGLGYVAVGRYTYGETTFGFPPRSILYADIGREWDNDRERLRQLHAPVPSS